MGAGIQQPSVQQGGAGSTLADLVKVLYEPVPVFERVRERPRFLVPFLAVVAVQLVFFFVNLPFIKAATAAPMYAAPSKNKQRDDRLAVRSHHLRATQRGVANTNRLPEAPAGFLGWLLGGGFLLRRPLRFAGALLCCFARRLLLAGCHDSSFRNAKLALANLAKNNYRIKLENYSMKSGGLFI